uniref:Solute-binding protein family 3/N-terminal domain-containing protein n=1 Tax=Anopheles coluzzii TaxID=1518534 RepID=A0A6E8WEF1_ANOCL
MLWCKASTLWLLLVNQVLAQSTVQVVERIVHQAFHTKGHVNTLIFWDGSDPLVSNFNTSTYPRVVFDRTTGLKETSLGDNCLVIMVLKAVNEDHTYELLNVALSDSVNHYLAKYLIILDKNRATDRIIGMITYIFEHLNIMKFAIVINDGMKRNVGYMNVDKFTVLNQTADFEAIFNARLKNQPFRAVITDSLPYSYVSNQGKLVGLDVEIAEIITQKMGVALSIKRIEAWEHQMIGNLLEYNEMDIYLTRRGCNRTLIFPQIHLQDRFSVRILMPKMQMISFNLQFLKPYSPEVWYFLLISITIACTLSYIFWSRHNINILMVIIFGYHQETSGLKALLVLAIEFLKFILLEAYFGQVTLFMIQLRYQANPQTLEQFFATDIKLNVPEIMNHFFNQLPDTTRQRIRNKLKQHQMFVNEIDTYSPDYAYLITQYGWDVLRDELSYASTFNSSHFYIMKEPLYETSMCYIFGIWSKFQVKYKENLDLLYAAGIINKLTNEAWRPSNKGPKGDSSTVLMLPDLVPVFYFIFYGWTISAVCFAIEIAINKGRIMLSHLQNRLERLFVSL